MRQSAELFMVSTDALSSKLVPYYHGERAMARSLLKQRTGSSFQSTAVTCARRVIGMSLEQWMTVFGSLVGGRLLMVARLAGRR